MNNILLTGTINDYPFPGADLNGCNYDQYNVLNLVEPLKVEAHHYKDSEWTKEKARREIRGFAESMKEGTFTFHQSSHGTYDRDPKTGKLRQGLFMVDGQVYYDYEFVEDFNLFSPKVKVEIWLDACFAGGMERLFGAVIKPRFFQLKSFDGERVERNELPVIKAALRAGCRSDQTCADALIDNQPQGAFTWGLVKTFGFNNSIEKNNSLTVKKLRGRFEQVPTLLGDADYNIASFGQEVKKKCFLR